MANSQSSIPAMGSRFPRRRFLQAAAAMTAAGCAAGGAYWANRAAVRLALVGAGTRGEQLAWTIKNDKYAAVYGQIVAFQDVNRPRAEKLASACFPGADVVSSFEQVLERKDIQGVVIATPDHWHTPMSVAALRAGKAVYCEKPMTLTIGEGQLLIKTVQETGGVFLVGTQQRSCPYFQTACNLIRNGRLGTLRKIDITLPENLVGGPFEAHPVPAGLDWNRWLGQAPMADYSEDRYTNWRGFTAYGGGRITDWGPHHIDIAQWAMKMDGSGPLLVEGQGTMQNVPGGFEFPQPYKVRLVYPNGVELTIQGDPRQRAITFVGDDGTIRVNREGVTGEPFEALAQNPLPADADLVGHSRRYHGDRGVTHLQHFYDCILTGARPISDVESQHRSMTACHLANLSLRLGRAVHWDPKAERFLDDSAADAEIHRAAREGFEIG